MCTNLCTKLSTRLVPSVVSFMEEICHGNQSKSLVCATMVSGAFRNRNNLSNYCIDIDYQRKRIQSGAQGRTVNIEVATLRQFPKANDLWLRFSNKERMLRERRDVAKALTLEQERILLHATAEADSTCHTATVLALNTAMRKDEIRRLQWAQVDFDNRILVVGHSKTEAGTGRLIPLNAAAFDALVRWAGRFPETKAEHFVFPSCENRQIDPARPTRGWRTAWRNALRRAGLHCRFHDLLHTCITKLAESQVSDMTILAIAGHVSKSDAGTLQPNSDRGEAGGP